jgi:hypothetical protein
MQQPNLGPVLLVLIALYRHLRCLKKCGRGLDIWQADTRGIFFGLSIAATEVFIQGMILDGMIAKVSEG